MDTAPCLAPAAKACWHAGLGGHACCRCCGICLGTLQLAASADAGWTVRLVVATGGFAGVCAVWCAGRISADVTPWARLCRFDFYICVMATCNTLMVVIAVMLGVACSTSQLWSLQLDGSWRNSRCKTTLTTYAGMHAVSASTSAEWEGEV